MFRPYDILPTRIVHITKDLRYLLYLILFAAELIHELACSYSIYTVLIFLLLAGTYCIKDLDLDLKLVDLDSTWTWLLLDFIQVY